jgi:HAD superfamily hydrolase (TIGR01484 family)
MRYLALATDYDGTLATDGRVPDHVVSALERLRASDRRLLMVTGRELDELQTVFDRFDLFEWIVAENGGLLFSPETKELRPQGDPPPPGFVEDLRRRGVERISVGEVIVATWEPHQATVLDTIKDHGLEHQIVFNKGAVMVLPPNVNKRTGLAAALAEMGVSEHNVVGVGDAENDLGFLAASECGVAVSNALPSVKDEADLVMNADHGDGVVELAEMLLEDDLARVDPNLKRHRIDLGELVGGEGRFDIPPAGETVLVAGPSGSGKSTLVDAMLERLNEQVYRFALIDPEGDYDNASLAVVLGTPQREPAPEEILDLLRRQDASVTVNLLAVPLEDRPAFFDSLIPPMQSLRARTGVPHWLIVDEAHHLLGAERGHAALTVPKDFGAAMLITVHPEHLASEVLSSVDLMLVTSHETVATLESFTKAAGVEAPSDVPEIGDGEAVAWWVHSDDPPVAVRPTQPKEKQERHRRKYAEGDLKDRAFRFRGPDEQLDIPAKNLTAFLELSDGVDDETWRFHLERGDISRWFREGIKDDDLADEAAEVESNAEDLDSAESRKRIRRIVERRYTAPA